MRVPSEKTIKPANFNDSTMVEEYHLAAGGAWTASTCCFSAVNPASVTLPEVCHTTRPLTVDDNQISVI